MCNCLAFVGMTGTPFLPFFKLKSPVYVVPKSFFLPLYSDLILILPLFFLLIFSIFALVLFIFFFQSCQLAFQLCVLCEQSAYLHLYVPKFVNDVPCGNAVVFAEPLKKRFAYTQ